MGLSPPGATRSLVLTLHHGVRRSGARRYTGCMATVTFDTLYATRKLREAGFDEKQAETVVRVLAASQDGLITREHFDARFAVVDAKMDKITWMVGVVIALAAANFAKQFF